MADMLMNSLEDRMERGQNLLSGEVLLPRLILKQSALEHNIYRMAQYCREHGVSLAPHAKTTMSPGILQRQAEAGVWGFTVATTTQAQRLRGLGVKRILIANEVVEARAIEWLALELSRDDGFEAFVLVDSLQGVSILNGALGTHRLSRPLNVLIELGERGMRAGCRTDEEAMRVADAVKVSPYLRLAGVESFEALLEPTPMRVFLQRMRTLATRLAQERHFDGAKEVIVSVGSSEHMQPTVEALADWPLYPPVRKLLRPGGYATTSIMPGYKPSLEIWSAVVSRPEPNLAIAGFGQREVPEAAKRLPIPEGAGSRGQLRRLNGQANIVRLYDQHATVELIDAELEIGEFLGCSVVSPYRPAFGTWRTVPLVDDDYTVVEVLDVLY